MIWDRLIKWEKETIDLLNNQKRFDNMSKLHNPYGDGKASDKITNILKKHLI